IQEPCDLLSELRRVVSGVFLGLTFFFPEGDRENAAAIAGLGLSTDLLFRNSALTSFSKSGWEVRILASCQGRALPTPPSTILEGAKIDALPVAETTLDWCLLEAK
ncbi:MAG: hypothetical protein J7M05_06900, partial [Anaerolineae bacterium]|nr:hypothetical protein [Anaerolineae bacterium]